MVDKNVDRKSTRELATAYLQFLYNEAGQELAAKPAMCAFGGPGLDRLYVTTIAPAAPIAGYDPSLAGAVFVLNPHCTGLVDAAYAG